MPVIALALASTPPPCAGARNHYENLELDAAIAAAKATLEADRSRPLGCLAIQAMSQMVLGHSTDADKTLTELFYRQPNYTFNEPSLSPAMRDQIERARRSGSTMSVKGFAVWLNHQRLRIDISLEGGLRGANRVRYTTRTKPGGERQYGTVPIRGHVATATISVVAPAPVAGIQLSGVVLTDRDEVLHEFETQLAIGARPSLTGPSPVTMFSEPPQPADEGLGWPLWVGIGAVVVAGATVAAIFIAQPSLPNTDGTLGRIGVDP